MNYDNVMTGVAQQTSAAASPRQANNTPQMNNDQLMNTIALQIKRQGG